MLNLKRRLLYILRLYLGIAVSHSLFKLVTYLRSIQRVKRLWRNLPGKSPDLLAKGMQKNKLRINEYFSEDALKDPTHDLYKLPLPTPSLLAFSPRACKWLLKEEFRNFTKPNKGNIVVFMFKKLLRTYESVIFTRHHDTTSKEAKLWHTLRKLTANEFSNQEFMKLFHKTNVEKTFNVIEKLREEDGKVVDIQSMFSALAIDSAEQNLLGRNVNTISDVGNSDLGSAFIETQKQMAVAFYSILPISHLSRILLPFPFGSVSTDESEHFMYNLANWAFMSFNSQCHKYTRTIETLHQHVDKCFEEAQNDPNLSQRNDILAIFLKSNINLSSKNMRGLLLAILVGGMDTSAAALGWIIFELTQNKDIQKKIQEEIDREIGGSVPTLQQLSSSTKALTYLEGFINEVLRLHPPIALKKRVTVREIEYFDGTVIPKGTEITFSAYATGRNPLLYPEPERIKPERWASVDRCQEYEFLTFGGGLRNCVGKRLVLLQLKLVTVMLLQRFHFELKEGENISYSMTFVNAVSNNTEKTNLQLLVIPTERSQ